MDVNNKQPELKILEFDGAKYEIDTLTPRVIEGFNILMKLQNEILEHAYQLKKTEVARAGISDEIKSNIKEDKIKTIENEEEVNDVS